MHMHHSVRSGRQRKHQPLTGQSTPLHGGGTSGALVLLSSLAEFRRAAGSRDAQTTVGRQWGAVPHSTGGTESSLCCYMLLALLHVCFFASTLCMYDGCHWQH
ncbi:uncharacterized protein TrAtP1_003197 [Trichoderma atroviride]|uniref:uncharacterized protein n=1 Tax=Hypocrea atroviridis TaxID=63577 RepID=UPI00332E4B5A|nr:hypothetical protein TrAtP1_003197 [Trichoderma atroviride]